MVTIDRVEPLSDEKSASHDSRQRWLGYRAFVLLALVVAIVVADPGTRDLLGNAGRGWRHAGGRPVSVSHAGILERHCRLRGDVGVLMTPLTLVSGAMAVLGAINMRSGARSIPVRSERVR